MSAVGIAATVIVAVADGTAAVVIGVLDAALCFAGLVLVSADRSERPIVRATLPVRRR